MKVVVPDDYPVALSGTPAADLLRSLGDVTIHMKRGADNQEELVRRIADADVVMSLRAYSKFTDAVLASCPRLRMISVWGTGTDNVDLAACRARNITVTNTPGANAVAVAVYEAWRQCHFAYDIPSARIKNRST